MPMRRAPWPDVTIAVGLVALTVALPDALRWASAASVAIAATGVALRRVSPLAACVLACCGLLVAQLLPTRPEDIGTLLALLITVFSVGAYASRAHVVAGAAAAFGAAIGESALAASDDWPFAVTLVAIALAGGAALRRPLHRARRLTHRAQAAEREAAEAVARERARLARDLHDIVSHGVSVMVLQAAAADQLRDDPNRAATSLAAVQATGRETMSELQRLLGVLRAADEDELAPQPTLAQVGGLVEAVRAGGLEVSVAVHGARRRLPASVESSAFRVVQEALTNVLRHANARRADVTIEFGATALTLVVRDDGRSGGRAGPRRGNGLAGMRERVGLLGGTLDAGPRPEGGFAVQAVIPLGAVVP